MATDPLQHCKRCVRACGCSCVRLKKKSTVCMRSFTMPEPLGGQQRPIAGSDAECFPGQGDYGGVAAPSTRPPCAELRVSLVPRGVAVPCPCGNVGHTQRNRMTYPGPSVPFPRSSSRPAAPAPRRRHVRMAHGRPDAKKRAESLAARGMGCRNALGAFFHVSQRHSITWLSRGQLNPCARMLA